MKKTTIALAIAALGLAAADASAQVRRDRDGSFPSAKTRKQVRPVPATPAPRRVRTGTPSITSMAPSYGAPGTDVTIRGLNFQRGVKVRVGGTWVTPRSVTPRRIVFTIPARARNGQVVVKQSRTRAIKAGSFNVLRRPVAQRPVKKQRRFRASAAVRAEKRAHDQRIARLDRMIRQSSNDSILRRWLVNLKQRENTRHQRKMTNLRQRYTASL